MKKIPRFFDIYNHCEKYCLIEKEEDGICILRHYSSEYFLRTRTNDTGFYKIEYYIYIPSSKHFVLHREDGPAIDSRYYLYGELYNREMDKNPRFKKEDFLYLTKYKEKYNYNI